MYRLFYICLDKIACEYNADIKTEDLNNYRFLKLHNENISSVYDMAKTLPMPIKQIFDEEKAILMDWKPSVIPYFYDVLDKRSCITVSVFRYFYESRSLSKAYRRLQVSRKDSLTSFKQLLNAVYMEENPNEMRVVIKGNEFLPVPLLIPWDDNTSLKKLLKLLEIPEIDERMGLPYIIYIDNESEDRRRNFADSAMFADLCPGYFLTIQVVIPNMEDYEYIELPEKYFWNNVQEKFLKNLITLKDVVGEDTEFDPSWGKPEEYCCFVVTKLFETKGEIRINLRENCDLGIFKRHLACLLRVNMNSLQILKFYAGGLSKELKCESKIQACDMIDDDVEKIYAFLRKLPIEGPIAVYDYTNSLAPIESYKLLFYIRIKSFNKIDEVIKKCLEKLEVKIPASQLIVRELSERGMRRLLPSTCILHRDNPWRSRIYIHAGYSSLFCSANAQTDNKLPLVARHVDSKTYALLSSEEFFLEECCQFPLLLLSSNIRSFFGLTKSKIYFSNVGLSVKLFQ
ncbi:unnamed protein product [Dracunculus medinensis]|uniref:Ubiquitinyl hydrolase 1 n=1 Tax=Dracunculus medinensis TaxID=318479 RepID=A0A0N4UAV8_DRAME|nr:unnamed protein product [Dracunculus medinensis]